MKVPARRASTFINYFSINQLNRAAIDSYLSPGKINVVKNAKMATYKKKILYLINISSNKRVEATSKSN
ncbi:MAG: hypothetical protein Kow00121_57010 [Elainellaceae cyanobacterium]